MDLDMVETMSVLKNIQPFFDFEDSKSVGATEQGLHIQLMTAENVEAEIKNEYGNKLVIDRITIGNPFDIKKKGLVENDGIIGLLHN